MKTFNLARPFNRLDVEKLEDKQAQIRVYDSGLTHTYEGIVKHVTNGKTKVGEDEIFNECVVAVICKEIGY